MPRARAGWLIAGCLSLGLWHASCDDGEQAVGPPGSNAKDGAAPLLDAARDALHDATRDAVHDAPGDALRDVAGPDAPDGGNPVDARSSVFSVYLAPPESGGNDANTGTDQVHPIATLRRALEIVTAQKPARDVEVLMAAGTYYDQDVVWTYTSPEHAVTFKPLVDGSTVVFDGCSNGSEDYAANCPDHTAHGDADGQFFLLGNHPAGDTNLRFEHLEIRHYRNGIRFTNGASARNRIAYSYIHHIGNGWAPNLSYAAAPGYGAVRTRRSSYNEFVGNHFAHIENVPGSCEVCAGHMHSYYLWDESDHNTFTGDTHEYVSGGPVRFRDYSNHNVVRSSTFIAGGLAKGAVSDYYSETDGECPCYDIQIEDIRVFGDWDCAAASPVWISYEAASSCTRPALGVRASGSGNCGATSAPYCSTSTACQPLSVNP